jgi:hypothetical protein
MTGWWLWATLAFGGPVGEGAQAYADGDLEQAVSVWDDAMGGVPSGALLYNLGTAWYRRGDPARSVAYLRGALALRPRDGSVHHNLALARSELGSVPAPVDPPVAWSLVVTPGELGLLGVLVTGLGSLLVVVGVRREGLTMPGVAALGVGLTMGAAATWGGLQQQWHPIGVVVDQPIALRDAASLQGRARTELPVGTEVRVDRHYGGFLLVEDGRGKRGWVPDGALVVPRRHPEE